MSNEQNATAEAVETKAAKATKNKPEAKDVPNKFKINVAALPFTEARMALPKSIKPSPFKDGNGGQISIVKGQLRLGTTEAWLPFGVVLRWAGKNTAQLVPAVQMPKLGADKFEPAIRTDDVGCKAALDTLERDLSAQAVKFYQSEIKKSERTNGGAVASMSAAVQTFNAADLGISIALDDTPKLKKNKPVTVPDAENDDE